MTAQDFPSSLLTAVIAATHGVYKSVNTKNTSDVNGVSILSIPFPASTVNVLTTLSFAVNPVISAVDILQSFNPSGANKGAIIPPISANRLSAESVTTLSLVSKFCKNHIIIVARNIIVKAFVIKSFAFSQTSCATFLALGNR